MGLFKVIFAALAPKKADAIPLRRTAIQTGFYWKVGGLTALAAGRGFTQSVVGESFYKKPIEDAVGGPTTIGVKVSVTAVLRPSTHEGRPSIDVLLNGTKCGSIPKHDVSALTAELFALSDTGVASAKARVRSGFEGADYCIELNMKRPLAVRND